MGWISVVCTISFAGIVLSLLCSDRVRHCRRLSVVCASRLVRLICCRIIMTASSPGSLLVLSSSPSGRVRSAVAVRLGPMHMVALSRHC